MQGVIVEFQYTDDFDRTRIEGIAREARGGFEGLLGASPEGLYCR